MTEITQPTLFYSAVLEDTVVIVPDNANLEMAATEYAGMVVYTVSEMGSLAARLKPLPKETREPLLREAHLIKTLFGGEVLDPEKVPPTPIPEHRPVFQNRKAK